MSRVAVFGSVNVDRLCRVDADTAAALADDPAVPAVGETAVVTAPPPGFTADDTALGGKGANQAIAAARAGAATLLAGAVGVDAPDWLAERLATAGVEARLAVRGDRTGAAYVWVEPDGENRIAVLPGANDRLDPDDAVGRLDRFRSADAVLLQNEVPVAAATTLLDALPADGPTVIVDPAPAAGAAPLVDHPAVDVFVPNETEFDRLRVPLTAAVERGATVVRTDGAAGATVFVGDPDTPAFRVAAPTVRVVDTTGAGDALAGTLAATLADAPTLRAAVRRGVRAGSRACEHPGATPPDGG